MEEVFVLAAALLGALLGRLPVAYKTRARQGLPYITASVTALTAVLEAFYDTTRTDAPTKEEVKALVEAAQALQEQANGLITFLHGDADIANP